MYSPIEAKNPTILESYKTGAEMPIIWHPLVEFQHEVGKKLGQSILYL